MSATVLLLGAILISIQYCISLTDEESEAVELLEKYNIGDLWYALKESKFDDTSLWPDIDQDMLKNMNVLDSDRLRFKKLQNELKQQNESNWSIWTHSIVDILNSGAVKVVASVVAFIAMIFTKYKEMKACCASLFPMNKQEIITDTPYEENIHTNDKVERKCEESQTKPETVIKSAQHRNLVMDTYNKIVQNRIDNPLELLQSTIDYLKSQKS
eukprot:849572_1